MIEGLVLSPWHFQTLASSNDAGGGVQRCPLCWGWGATLAAKQSLPSSIQKEPTEDWSRIDGDVTGSPQDGTQSLALSGSQHPCPQVQMSFVYRGMRPRPHVGTLIEHHNFILCGFQRHLKTEGKKSRRDRLGLSMKKNTKLPEILSLPFAFSPFLISLCTYSFSSALSRQPSVANLAATAA